MSNKNGNRISLNKISFWLLVVTAILYLVAMVLKMVGGISLAIIGAMQGVASALMICVVAVLAYRFVANKGKDRTVWMVLYIIVLLIVLVAIVLPLIF